VAGRPKPTGSQRSGGTVERRRVADRTGIQPHHSSLGSAARSEGAGVAARGRGGVGLLRLALGVGGVAQGEAASVPPAIPLALTALPPCRHPQGARQPAVREERRGAASPTSAKPASKPREHYPHKPLGLKALALLTGFCATCCGIRGCVSSVRSSLFSVESGSGLAAPPPRLCAGYVLAMCSLCASYCSRG